MSSPNSKCSIHPMSSSHSIESLSHSFTVLTHLLHLFASCSVSIFIHLISEVIRVLIGCMKNSKSKFWNLNMASSTYSLNWLIKNDCYSYFLPVGEHLKIHILFSQTFAKKKIQKNWRENNESGSNFETYGWCSLYSTTVWNEIKAWQLLFTPL